MNIGVIGAGGNLAGAVISAFQNTEKLKSNKLFLFDPRVENLSRYAEKGAQICESNADVVRQSDYVVLAVKPQVIFDIIDQFKAEMTPEKCIISVAAGISIESIKNAVGFDCKVVRVMPNTPLMLSQGASGVSCKPPVSREEFEFALSIFSSAGIAVECDEEQINTVTAVSGSGPAYVFKFAKAIIDQAEKMGLPYEKASELMYQTLIGSAVMLRDSGKTPQQLIDMVTSPKGTTLAALESFDGNNFDSIVMQAVEACKNRADELGKS